MLGFISLVVLVFSVIVHEVAHGYAADALGDPTPRLAGRLTMNPVPHIDPIGSVILPLFLVLTHSPFFIGWAKPVPYNPYNISTRRFGETLVAVAGSATNLFIAVLFGLIVRVNPFALGPDALSIAALICFINLSLGCFNLIPLPPLDGFTVLRSALPWQMGVSVERFEQQLRSLGMVGLILVLVLFYAVFSGPFFDGLWSLFTLLTGSGG
jgi:Zn-dependent protease